MPQPGQEGVWPLTWHRHKKFDGITVPVEAELGLGHRAVGDEAAGRLVTAVVAIHVDDAPWAGSLPRCGGRFVGWRERRAAGPEPG